MSIEILAKIRKVPFLLHFTRTENLDSIVEHGLVPRTEFHRLSVSPVVSDDARYDYCPGATSLSIGFPNYKMLWQNRCEKKAEWCIVVISPEVLWENDCAFCVDNAAKKEVSSIEIGERKGPEAFEAMFKEVKGRPTRNVMRLPDYYPTNPQAEVLVFGRIDFSMIKCFFFDFKPKKALPKESISGKKCIEWPDFFKPRHDYLHWKHEMAQRPVYIPTAERHALVTTKYVDFKWHAGMSPAQKQKSIDSLHESARESLKLPSILEVSSKSRIELGIQLSAFNLAIRTQKTGREFSVECAYQSSKVFENGGPFTDLLNSSSREAKKDPRLTSSGRLVGFRFYNKDWPLEPRTAFYDWLYINALNRNPELGSAVVQYSAFTDIEFNPEKSFNCQAYSVALFIALKKSGLLEEALKSSDDFTRIVSRFEVSNAHQDEDMQKEMKF